MTIFGLYISVTDWSLLAANALAALSFHVTARAGALSIAQVAFMAVGAYISVLLQQAGVSSVVVLLLAATFGAGLLGLLTGVALRNVSGIFLAIATAALIRVVQLLAAGVEPLGGVSGLYSVPVVTPGLAAAVLVIALVLVAGLWRRPAGLATTLMGEDPEMARSVGVSTRLYRIQAFGVGGMLAGAAGAVYGLSVGFIGPALFNFEREIYIVFGAVLGGALSPFAATGGAVLTTLLLIATADAGEWRLVMFGTITLVCILLRPQGLLVFGHGARGPSPMLRAIRRRMARANLPKAEAP